MDTKISSLLLAIRKFRQILLKVVQITYESELEPDDEPQNKLNP